MFYLRQRSIIINLIVMSIIWFSTSFNYYLLSFLISTFENVYPSALLSSCAEITAYAVAGLLYRRAGLKISISLSFLIGLIGGLLILFIGLKDESAWYFSLFVLVCRFGMAQNFNIIYCSNADVFPILFCATAMGICNFLSRVFSALSPIISTLEEPLPMIIFCSTSTLAGLIVWVVQMPKKEGDSTKSVVLLDKEKGFQASDNKDSL